MKLTKKHILPAFAVIGLLTLGGLSAQAFNLGTNNLAAFTNFSQAEQTAIQKSFDIRQAAEVEADKVLAAAGLDKTKLHQAIMTYHQGEKSKFEASITAGDYKTFSDLVKGSPMAKGLTEENFNKLVEAHKLRQAGDMAGARKIMESVGFKGLGLGMGMMGGRGHRGFGGGAGMMDDDAK